MTHDPVELLSATLPNLFNAAIAELRRRAAAGDSDAQKRLDELIAAPPVAARVTLEGKPSRDLFMLIENAAMTTVESAPSAPVVLALGVSREAFEVTLEELADDVDAGLERLKRRLLRLSAARAQASIQKLRQDPVRFHYVVTDTPDFEEVRVKVALGDGIPPSQPTFTITLDHDTFEELRSRKIKPQALLARLQLSGDASRAMQWLMEQAQKRSG